MQWLRICDPELIDDIAYAPSTQHGETQRIVTADDMHQMCALLFVWVHVRDACQKQLFKVPRQHSLADLSRRLRAGLKELPFFGWLGLLCLLWIWEIKSLHKGNATSKPVCDTVGKNITQSSSRKLVHTSTRHVNELWLWHCTLQ